MTTDVCTYTHNFIYSFGVGVWGFERLYSFATKQLQGTSSNGKEHPPFFQCGEFLD